MPGPQTYAATPDERLYGDKPRYTTHLCHRFLLLPLLAPQFRFLVNGNRTKDRMCSNVWKIEEVHWIRLIIIIL